VAANLVFAVSLPHCGKRIIMKTKFLQTRYNYPQRFAYFNLPTCKSDLAEASVLEMQSMPNIHVYRTNGEAYAEDSPRGPVFGVMPFSAGRSRDQFLVLRRINDGYQVSCADFWALPEEAWFDFAGTWKGQVGKFNSVWYEAKTPSCLTALVNVFTEQLLRYRGMKLSAKAPSNEALKYYYLLNNEKPEKLPLPAKTEYASQCIALYLGSASAHKKASSGLAVHFDYHIQSLLEALDWAVKLDEASAGAKSEPRKRILKLIQESLKSERRKLRRGASAAGSDHGLALLRDNLYLQACLLKMFAEGSRAKQVSALERDCRALALKLDPAFAEQIEDMRRRFQGSDYSDWLKRVQLADSLRSWANNSRFCGKFATANRLAQQANNLLHSSRAVAARRQYAMQ
jgi:hypothetical protein